MWWLGGSESTRTWKNSVIKSKVKNEATNCRLNNNIIKWQNWNLNIYIERIVSNLNQFHTFHFLFCYISNSISHFVFSLKPTRSSVLIPLNSYWPKKNLLSILVVNCTNLLFLIFWWKYFMIFYLYFLTMLCVLKCLVYKNISKIFLELYMQFASLSRIKCKCYKCRGDVLKYFGSTVEVFRNFQMNSVSKFLIILL